MPAVSCVVSIASESSHAMKALMDRTYYVFEPDKIKDLQSTFDPINPRNALVIHLGDADRL